MLPCYTRLLGLLPDMPALQVLPAPQGRHPSAGKSCLGPRRVQKHAIPAVSPGLSRFISVSVLSRPREPRLAPAMAPPLELMPLRVRLKGSSGIAVDGRGMLNSQPTHSSVDSPLHASRITVAKSPSIPERPWTATEDVALISLVPLHTSHGVTLWSSVATGMDRLGFRRPVRSCRQRRDFLRKRDGLPWAVEEDAIILREASRWEKRVRWSFVGAKLEDAGFRRSVSDVKARCGYLREQKKDRHADNLVPDRAQQPDANSKMNDANPAPENAADQSGKGNADDPLPAEGRDGGHHEEEEDVITPVPTPLPGLVAGKKPRSMFSCSKIDGLPSPTQVHDKHDAVDRDPAPAHPRKLSPKKPRITLLPNPSPRLRAQKKPRGQPVDEKRIEDGKTSDVDDPRSSKGGSSDGTSENDDGILPVVRCTLSTSNADALPSPRPNSVPDQKDADVDSAMEVDDISPDTNPSRNRSEVAEHCASQTLLEESQDPLDPITYWATKTVDDLASFGAVRQHRRWTKEEDEVLLHCLRRRKCKTASKWGNVTLWMIQNNYPRDASACAVRARKLCSDASACNVPLPLPPGPSKVSIRQRTKSAYEFRSWSQEEEDVLLACLARKHFNNGTLDDVEVWMREDGFPRSASACSQRAPKLRAIAERDGVVWLDLLKRYHSEDGNSNQDGRHVGDDGKGSASSARTERQDKPGTSEEVGSDYAGNRGPLVDDDEGVEVDVGEEMVDASNNGGGTRPKPNTAEVTEEGTISVAQDEIASEGIAEAGDIVVKGSGKKMQQIASRVEVATATVGDFSACGVEEAAQTITPPKAMTSLVGDVRRMGIIPKTSLVVANGVIPKTNPLDVVSKEVTANGDLVELGRLPIEDRTRTASCPHESALEGSHSRDPPSAGAKSSVAVRESSSPVGVAGSPLKERRFNRSKTREVQSNAERPVALAVATSGSKLWSKTEDEALIMCLRRRGSIRGEWGKVSNWMSEQGFSRSWRACKDRTARLKSDARSERAWIRMLDPGCDVGKMTTDSDTRCEDILADHEASQVGCAKTVDTDMTDANGDTSEHRREVETNGGLPKQVSARPSRAAVAVAEIMRSAARRRSRRLVEVTQQANADLPEDSSDVDMEESDGGGDSEWQPSSGGNTPQRTMRRSRRRTMPVTRQQSMALVTARADVEQNVYRLTRRRIVPISVSVAASPGTYSLRAWSKEDDALLLRLIGRRARIGGSWNDVRNWMEDEGEARTERAVQQRAKKLEIDTGYEGRVWEDVVREAGRRDMGGQEQEPVAKGKEPNSEERQPEDFTNTYYDSLSDSDASLGDTNAVGPLGEIPTLFSEE